MGAVRVDNRVSCRPADGDSTRELNWERVNVVGQESSEVVFERAGARRHSTPLRIHPFPSSVSGDFAAVRLVAVIDLADVT